MNTKIQKVNFTWSLNTLLKSLKKELQKSEETLHKKARSKNINTILKHMHLVKNNYYNLIF
jgi:hypothetical protein